MVPDEIRRKRDALAGAPCQVRWCDDEDLNNENMEGVGPGGWLNVFGWYVVGTTGGGSAIVLGVDDPAVYFADHEWYGGDITADNTIDFEDFGGNGARLTSRTINDWNGQQRVVERLHGEWVSVPFTAGGMRRSLFQLASSIDEFCERAVEVDALLDKIV